MVEARRTISDGTEAVLVIWILLVQSSVLTSGSIFMLITPDVRTVGVNARLTPNRLYSMVILL